MDTKDLQNKIKEVYMESFGKTPLRQRLEDIQGEVSELCRYTDLINLREEAGDALSSLIQLANEADWSIDDLINENLTKIKSRASQYKALGRKTKVAILGGAFNPVTEGHIQLAQFILNTSSTFDEVWLMPCYSHMYGKEMASAEHRVNMCNLATRVDARIKVSTYEIDNKLSGETYHLCKQLLSEDFAKNEYDFSMILGMDNANTFSKWVNYQDLERMMRFIVVDRYGVEKDSNIDWYLKYPHIYLSDENKKGIEISSTLVRNNLKDINGKWGMEALERLEECLHWNVLSYILKNKLYIGE